MASVLVIVSGAAVVGALGGPKAPFLPWPGHKSGNRGGSLAAPLQHGVAIDPAATPFSTSRPGKADPPAAGHAESAAAPSGLATTPSAAAASLAGSSGASAGAGAPATGRGSAASGPAPAPGDGGREGGGPGAGAPGGGSGSGGSGSGGSGSGGSGSGGGGPVPAAAQVAYTGPAMLWASPAARASAPGTLSATVRVGPSAGGSADIRTARVTFVDRGSGARLCGPLTPVPIPGGGVAAGTVRCGVRLAVPAAAAGSVNTVGAVVSGGYTRDSSADNAVITAARRLGAGVVAGGGYLTEYRSAGVAAADRGSVASFGVALRYGGGGNPQGGGEVIVRSHGRTYQVTSSAVTSLTVTPAGAGHPGTAEFTGTASIEDVTNPSAPVPADRSATISVQMTDGGSPSSDKLALAAWDHSGALWFSSNWNGSSTVQQSLGGGDLAVR